LILQGYLPRGVIFLKKPGLIFLYDGQGDLVGVEEGGDVAEADAGEFECGGDLCTVVHEVPQAVAQFG